MKFQQTSVNIDQPFTAQKVVKDICSSSSKGLIPEIVLYRLLRVAELAVREELNRIGAKKELLGLQLRYEAPFLNTGEGEEIYSVEWGKFPLDEDQTNTEEETENDSNLNDNSLSLEFISTLITRLQEAIKEYTPPALLEGRSLIVGVGVHITSFSQQMFMSNSITSAPLGDYIISECTCPNKVKRERLRVSKNGRPFKCTEVPCQ